MTARRVAGIALAAFAVGTVGFVFWKDLAASRHRMEAEAQGRKVVVYYFHGNVHCPACDKIEALGRAAVESGFEEEIRKGLVEWRPVDTDRAGNEHYVYEYALLTRSIVVSDVRGGRQKGWKNLDRVWELLDTPKAFTRYVQDEVAAYVGSP